MKMEDHEKHEVDELMPHDPNKKEVHVPEEPPKLDPATVTRAVVYALAAINGAAAMFGFGLDLVVDEAVLYETLSYVFWLAAMGHAFWKNQNWTPFARKQQSVADQAVDKEEEKLKAQQKKKGAKI
jgi:SPP1 family holin